MQAKTAASRPLRVKKKVNKLPPRESKDVENSVKEESILLAIAPHQHAKKEDFTNNSRI